MAKDYSFQRFFKNPDKSQAKESSGIHQREKRHGRVVWNSLINGTYVRSIHGELKFIENLFFSK